MPFKTGKKLLNNQKAYDQVSENSDRKPFLLESDTILGYKVKCLYAI